MRNEVSRSRREHHFLRANFRNTQTTNNSTKKMMLSPRNEHHFLGAAISGIFGTLQQSSANRANFRNTQTTNKFNMLEAQNQHQSEQQNQT